MSAPTSPKRGGGATLSFHRLLVEHAPDYLRRFDAAMPARVRQVLRRILRCRTPALGGQLLACPECGTHHYRYHSCNDRHCPQCGDTDAAAWLQRHQRRLELPVPFFLVTFTVPEALRRGMRRHPRRAYDALMAASARALHDLARNPQRLGARLGFLGVLHTWSRTLIHHPHVHFLVPGGGLSLDRQRWIASRPGFLLAVHPLAERFRTLFRRELQRRAPEALHTLPRSLWNQRWVVHSQPVGSGANALRYLSRYVFKTATGNRRLLRGKDGRVRWDYRDSATGKPGSIWLEPQELIRRFLQHVLPTGYTRVRWFGWLHPAQRAEFRRVRACLDVSTPTADPPDPETPKEPVARPLCPRCQRELVLIGTWRAGQTPPGQARAPP